MSKTDKVLGTMAIEIDKRHKIVFFFSFCRKCQNLVPLGVCVSRLRAALDGRHFLLSPRSINLELARCHGRLARTLTFHSIR